MFEKQLKRPEFYDILHTVFPPDNENIKKALTFLFLNIGMFIFAMVVFMKVDVMSQKIHAEVQSLSADLDWESFQHHQAGQNILKER